MAIRIRKGIAAWLRRVAIALDQLVGSLLFNNDPDTTISAQAWIWYYTGKRRWPCKMINFLFFREDNHCRASFLSELRASQQAEEIRKHIANGRK